MSTTLGVFHQERKTDEDIVRREEEEVGENRIIFVIMLFVACC